MSSAPSLSVQVLGLATGAWALCCAKGQQFTASCLGLCPPELNLQPQCSCPQALNGFSTRPILSWQWWLFLRLNWSTGPLDHPTVDSRCPHLSFRSPWNECTKVRIFGKPFLLQVYLKTPVFKQQQNTKLRSHS